MDFSLRKDGRMCSETDRYYIFESSPLKHFSRFDAERCDMLVVEKLVRAFAKDHGVRKCVV